MRKNREQAEEPLASGEKVAELPGAGPPDLLREFTGYLLRQVSARFSADTSVAGVDLRGLSVMEALAERVWVSQLDLAEALNINRTIMVSVIGRMEELGQVARDRNPENRRSYLLSLTDSGRADLAKMRRAAATRDLSLTSQLSDSERARLGELLTALVPPAPTGAASPTIQALVARAAQYYYKLGNELIAGSGLQMRYLAPLSGLASLAPCAQQELARLLAITEPAAAELVDALVRAGLVQRGRDKVDRRRYALELTDSGKRAKDEFLDAAREQEAYSVSRLGPEGAAELKELLLKLLNLPVAKIDHPAASGSSS